MARRAIVHLIVHLKGSNFLQSRRPEHVSQPRARQRPIEAGQRPRHLAWGKHACMHAVLRPMCTLSTAWLKANQINVAIRAGMCASQSDVFAWFEDTICLRSAGMCASQSDVQPAPTLSLCLAALLGRLNCQLLLFIVLAFFVFAAFCRCCWGRSLVRLTRFALRLRFAGRCFALSCIDV